MSGHTRLHLFPLWESLVFWEARPQSFLVPCERNCRLFPGEGPLAGTLGPSPAQCTVCYRPSVLPSVQYTERKGHGVQPRAKPALENIKLYFLTIKSVYLTVCPDSPLTKLFADATSFEPEFVIRGCKSAWGTGGKKRVGQKTFF